MTAPRAAGGGSASRESGDGRDVGGAGGEGSSSPGRKPAEEGEEVARGGHRPRVRDRPPRQGGVVLLRVGRR